MLRSFFAHFKLPGGVRRQVGLCSFLLLAALVIGACGSSSTSSTSNSSDLPSSSNSSAGGGQPVATPGAGGTGTTSQPTLPNGTPANTYLIRTLSVTLVVNRPLDANTR